MAAPKGNKVSKVLNSLQGDGQNAQSKIPNYTSDQQEIDLNLSLGGFYNGKNPKETPMPQSFSSLRASAAKNSVFTVL
ncbi:hypothetical protein RND71_021828 [Anisodus tanguticus]|uniref:Uncharacterized protein n=1 Tax=Anisodus tanguticus TaxID=243964 RepID=A0AAE1RYJ3_9SOLA|nr:hypothetical protein RND71_021828 [Anisodus tanguticus]